MSRVIGLVMIGFIAVGCGPRRPAPPPPVEEPATPALTPDDRQTAQDLFGRRPLETDPVPDGTTVVQLHFHVWRFQMPRVSSEFQAQLFKHLDESGIAAEQARTLKANGLRAAIGSPTSWRTVRALLMSRKPTPHEQAAVSESGRPLKVELVALPADEALFVFGADGQLRGTRMPGGVLCWHIDHALDLARVGHLHLRLVPEVLVGERIGGQWTTGLDAPEILRFEEMTLDIDLARDEYLIIGPSARPRLEHLLGLRYVSGTVEGTPHDVFYCLVPKLVQRTITPRR